MLMPSLLALPRSPPSSTPSLLGVKFNSAGALVVTVKKPPPNAGEPLQHTGSRPPAVAIACLSGA